MNFFKDSRTNWKYILIVVLLAVIVGEGISWWAMKQEIPLVEFPEVKIKRPEKIVTSQQVISSDKEISEILKEFAGEKFFVYAKRSDIDVYEYNEILLDALEFKDENLKDRLKTAKKELESLEIGDAPELRDFTKAYTKICIAESIIYNDLKNTLNYCQVEDMKPNDVEWVTTDEYGVITIVDDITAVSQILPYFLTGLAYYTEGDSFNADYYFRQVKLHQQAGIDQYGDDFLITAGEMYKKILDKTTQISSDATANWKIYRNEEYGFEVKYPRNWEYNAGPLPEVFLFGTTGGTDYDVNIWVEPSSRLNKFYENKTEMCVENLLADKKAYKCEGDNYIYLEAESNGKFYFLSVKGDKLSEKFNIFNQMLSTFLLLR